jgi:anti-anti-sigma factor
MAGELDLAASVSAHECMRRTQDGPETVVCDLGALSFIDVSGVRVLVDAAD